ncbi:hypothetical protein FIV42_16515 [Persicimonas caeni]|uniref:Uncharacterized protein n=1 Tax=Persicimonas caeni TaxID=2292766 RepID=A0A4Y6PVL5_PERCE|nr:hypothetical protein [Persicimonas caeni]QDG52283.1 hypothetical protein FIV42_16515 [Persicimonas caeni]QED33505.1 hypothetical protein FRD00_16510 [Persicimonas caeni]
MGFFDWIKGKSSSDEGSFAALQERAVERPLVTGLVQYQAGELVDATPEPLLERARLADFFREGGLAPVAPDTFDRMTAGWDVASWRRLALALFALNVRGGLAEDLALLARDRDVEQFVREGFIDLVEATDLLTMDILADSGVRSEEFARHLYIRLGITPSGETLAESIEKLEKLDYANLLEEAERAKGSAEERMAYLRKLQEEQEAQMGRRSKW